MYTYSQGIEITNKNSSRQNTRNLIKKTSEQLKKTHFHAKNIPNIWSEIRIENESKATPEKQHDPLPISTTPGRHNMHASLPSSRWIFPSLFPCSVS